MKLINITAFFCFFLSAYVGAWPTALDFSADIGTGDGYVITHSSEPDIRRCDALSTSWEIGDGIELVAPDTCHRYELIWAAHSNVLNKSETNLLKDTDNQASYNPSVVGTDWRLPTIKELVRLFNFSGNQESETSFTNNGITDPVIATWLAGVTDGYLISSTYRNLSGEVNGGAKTRFNQIFAIHIASGRVVPLRLKAASMLFCLGVDDDLNDDVGECDYFSEDGSKKNAALDYSEKIFYALKVSTQTVSELGYE